LTLLRFARADATPLTPLSALLMLASFCLTLLRFERVRAFFVDAADADADVVDFVVIVVDVDAVDDDDDLNVDDAAECPRSTDASAPRRISRVTRGDRVIGTALSSTTLTCDAFGRFTAGRTVGVGIAIAFRLLVLLLLLLLLLLALLLLLLFLSLSDVNTLADEKMGGIDELETDGDSELSALLLLLLLLSLLLSLLANGDDVDRRDDDAARDAMRRSTRCDDCSSNASWRACCNGCSIERRIGLSMEMASWFGASSIAANDESEGAPPSFEESTVDDADDRRGRYLVTSMTERRFLWCLCVQPSDELSCGLSKRSLPTVVSVLRCRAEIDEKVGEQLFAF
jgi:hypothetical protein